MFIPQFRYTHSIVNLLTKIEGLKCMIQSKEFSYDVKFRSQKQSKINDIFFLANLMGVSIDLKTAEKISMGSNLDKNEIPKETIYTLSNFRNCLEFNRSVSSDDFKEYDINTILHINKLVSSSWREVWTPQYRNKLTNIQSSSLDWFDVAEEIQNTNEIYSWLTEVLEWYKNETELNNLIKVGILIYRLIEIHPFTKNNLLTIMGLLDFIFIKLNLSYKINISIVSMFFNNLNELKKGVYYSKINKSIEYWLEALLTSISKELETVQNEIYKYIMEEEESKKKPFLDLNKRQIKILQYLQNVPYIKREEYCHILNVSTMTAFRDLSDLVRKKLLKIEGTGRGTKYKLYSM